METKKTILVTGGLWYIGSHAVVAFAEKWYQIVIIDNLSNTSISVLDNIGKILWYKPVFFECDLRDIQKLEKAFEKYDFDGVLHFAGLKSVWESCEKPSKYFDNNISGSLNLFNCMEKHGVRNIIFSSSATVYNFDNVPPYIESMPIGKTTNPYAYTKYNIECLLENLSVFSGFKVISLRYFNPIWAHKSWLIWEKPNGIPNNLLPYILKVAAWELSELQIFWDDYNTIDGTWVRDYIDVNDLIEWHVRAYKLLESQNSAYSESINLWTGKWTSVLEMLDICEEVIWFKISKNITHRRQWDLWEVYCEAKKAKDLLWWIYKISVKQSINNSWNFYKWV